MSSGTGTCTSRTCTCPTTGSTGTAAQIFERFLDAQLDNGFIGRRLLHPTLAARDHFKPFLAQIAVLACRQSGDCGWLAGHYYERLEKYLDYWFWFCDYDKNGLPVWDSAGHTGMDNQFRRAGNDGATWCEGVDLACYLLRELRAMVVLDELLGLAGGKERHRQHAEKLGTLINEVFWHERDGFYYDRNERTGAPIAVRAVSSFVPLWLGLPSRDQAARLITEHLLNSEEFWLNYPVATWAKSEPDYYQHRLGEECSWRGATWIPTNYMVFQGLRRYGYDKAARELAYRTFELVLAENDTREFYHAETGAGQGRNPFWGWSSLGYLMPLEYELDYDPSDLARGDRAPRHGGARGDFLNGRTS